MKCKSCGVDKLSKEFPPFKLTDNCRHPRQHCLRCVTSHYETDQTCSQCDQPILESSANMRKCYFMLEQMFPKLTENVREAMSATSGSITVTRVNGESFDMQYDANMTIKQLKQKVFEFMKIHPDKQNLFHNGNKLKEVDEKRVIRNTLTMCGVNPNSTIHVMVVLYAVPSNLDKVVLDLFWGFPKSGKDYLDASAWCFEGQRFDEQVTFLDKSRYHGALLHSGDRVDHHKREGHQLIVLDLHSIPKYVTHIFFTLSSYSSRTISHFQNPSMQFYDVNVPNVMLCEDKTHTAGHRTAIVMCSVQKVDGKWHVLSQGALTDGNAQNVLKPILETIQGIISQSGQYPHVPISLVTSTITDPEQLATLRARWE